MKIILASSSPRRKELLTQAGAEYICDPAEVDETVEGDTLPEEYVMALSLKKAEAVHERHPHDLVIGADTIVACDDKILGKPKDEEDALRMLRMLSGRSHIVCTGVTLIRGDSPDGKKTVDTFSVVTRVTMYSNDDETLRRYISTKEPMDKAGAYGIQGRGALLVQGIEGDFYNVMGLPIAEVMRHIKSLSA